jgi:hypothetical protein
MKQKHLLCCMFTIFIIAYIIYRLYTVREGLTETQCTQFTDCSKCTTEKTTSNTSCFWNSSLKKCGSFLDNGYSKKCS